MSDNQGPALGPLAYASWLLRRLTGVSEALLARVPGERGRYTGLGWAMAGTACLAMVGMAVLLFQVAALPLILTLALSAAWGLYILGFDYSIVTYLDHNRAMAAAQRDFSTELEKLPSPERRTSGRYVVRILLAIVLGVAIGESVVIAIFGSQSTSVLDDETKADIERSICSNDLQMHNYRPEIVPSAECAQLFADNEFAAAAYTALVTGGAVDAPSEGSGESGDEPDDPIAAQTQQTRDAIDANQARIDALDTEIVRLNKWATCERYPDQFTVKERRALGCSGRPGTGDRYTEAVAAVNRATNDRAALQTTAQELATQLSEIEQKITEQHGTQQQAEQETAERDRQEARDARQKLRDSDEANELARERIELVAKRSALEAGERPVYGLSERFTATERAVDGWLRWGVRILFVAVDLAPVLLKMTFGVSSVEQMQAIRQREAVYPVMQDLIRVEAAYRDGEDVRDYIRDDLLDDRWNRPRFGPLIALRQFLRRQFPDLFGREEREAPTAEPPRQAEGGVPQTAPERPQRDDSPGPKDNGAGREEEQSGAALLPIGNRLYTKISEVGVGNYASLYFVRPKGRQRYGDMQYPLVAKVPSTDRNVRKAALRAMATEVAIYRELQGSPNVPHMEVGDVDHGIVLRYYPRTSVDRWLYSDPGDDNSIDRRFSLDRVLKWSREITTGMVELWDLQYVHGDGKPGNLVITGPAPGMQFELVHEASDVLKLIDLGSVVETGHPVPTITPGYAPPEMVSGEEPHGTPLGDVYSFLGATMYYLCSGGVAPYWDRVAAEHVKGSKKVTTAWIEASQHGAPTPLRDLNPDVPLALARQIEQWMSSVPDLRLLLGRGDVPDWLPGTNWLVDRLNHRLLQQLDALGGALISEVGEDAYQAPRFGTRHELALSPIDLPDLTFDISEPEMSMR